ncbi:MAG: TonB-dependent receptor [Cyclobacteriaceae bacterium]
MKILFKIHLLHFIFLLSLFHDAFSQQETVTIGDSILSPVIISTFSGEMDIDSYVGTIEYVSPAQIRSTDQSSPLTLLNSISGVYMHSGALNTNRITIRGIGARTPFSTNKLRAYYGQIPLTDGVGETTIEDIDLNNWGHATILKGPVSSTYGSGLGGVLLIEPEKIEKGHNSIKISNDFGSFGLRKHGIIGEVSKGNTSLALGVSNQKSEGYRNNNQFDRYNICQRGVIQFGKNNLEWLGLMVDQFAEIPSSISQQDYLNDPEKAAFTWGASQGFEDYRKYLFGVTWSQYFNPDLDLKTTIYLNHRKNDEARPFNILDEKVFGIGARSAFFLSLKKSSIQFGAEVFTDNYHWMTYENLYEDTNGQGSLRGSLLTDNVERRGYFNLFSEYDYRFSEDFKLNLGLSASQTAYQQEKDFPVQEKTDYSYSLQVSPKVGFEYKPKQNFKLFGIVSRGFSPPSLEETLTPNGNINPDIMPEVGWNYEIGSQGNFFKRRVDLDLSIYLMQIKNLLVSRRTGLDQYIGINAGKTRHAGVEGGLQVKLIRQSNLSLDLNATFSFNNFKFIDFVDEENDYTGNQLTGVPEEKSSNQLTLRYSAFTFGVSHLYISEIPITDGNDVYTDPYHLFDLSLSYDNAWKKLKYRVGYRMNNVFNESYASMIAVNAQGFGNSAPRYYYPGLPTNHQISINIDLNWLNTSSNN